MVVANRSPAKEEVALDVPELRGFDAYVTSLMREWKVQGIGIAITRGDEVIYARGLGLRDVEGALPVTPHTIFPIGSTTKTFTSAALALLVDDGVLDWDTPVREYLPTFTLWDDFATQRMTPRDLLCHRSGLPRHDLMWYGSTRTRQELFDRLQYLQPNADFRTVWQYQNLMYMTAGYLVGVVTGSTWEEFVQARIFDPLGMASSKVTTDSVLQSPDFSIGYRRKGNTVTAMPLYEGFRATAPTGSIVSSVTDMGQWLRVHGHGGKLGDLQFLSEAQIRQLHTPQMLIGRGKHPETPYSSYGLGWFVEPYRGHDLIHHGGNIDGFSSQFSVLPDDGIGVVVLTNMDGTPVRDLIAYNVFDRFIGGEESPWNERARTVRKETEQAGKRGKARGAEERAKNTRPSHARDAYTGTYAHPGYGEIEITLQNKAFTARYNGLELDMRHRHYDVFDLHLERFDLIFPASFVSDIRGTIQTLSVPLEPTVADIVFTRLPEKSMTDPKILADFVGTYDLMGSPIDISLRATTLIVALPGQPEHELSPVAGTRFALKDLSSITIEFTRDEGGTVVEANVNQMGSLFVARKK